MQGKKERPDTTNRDKLLRDLLDQGISNDKLLEIANLMHGKPQEEKERIAAQLIKERGIV